MYLYMDCFCCCSCRTDLVDTGLKIRELGSAALHGESTAARLLSLQLLDAAKELQLVEETHWLFLLDPLALEEEVSDAA